MHRYDLFMKVPIITQFLEIYPCIPLSKVQQMQITNGLKGIVIEMVVSLKKCFCECRTNKFHRIVSQPVNSIQQIQVNCSVVKHQLNGVVVIALVSDIYGVIIWWIYSTLYHGYIRNYKGMPYIIVKNIYMYEYFTVHFTVHHINQKLLCKIKIYPINDMLGMTWDQISM